MAILPRLTIPFMIDHFSEKAGAWDQNDQRVANVQNIAQTIFANVALHEDMHLMDFGSGTGLLLAHVAPHVRKISGVDVSEAMNAQLSKKIRTLPCEVEILPVDLAQEALEWTFDGIISSMTMHHIEHIEAMFFTFYAHLNKGGFLAIADLDKEDGTFHTAEDEGVYHLGFERDVFENYAIQAGFSDVCTSDASIIYHDDRTYPVFLLSATKQDE